MNYYSNVLIIADPKHPENVGQVKIFKYGKKIFEKIMSAAKPIFDDETPVNVFDYWEGANFKLKMRQVDGYPNYDSSVFVQSEPLGTDEEILRVANSQYLLNEFLDPKNFKSAEELKKRLEFVLNSKTSTQTANQMAEENSRTAAPIKSAPAPFDESDDGDLLGYFQNLVDED